MHRIFAGAALALMTLTLAAEATETGFASIHSQRREGGRTCLVDHFHYGTGSGASKQAAEKSAIAAWVSFTAFEYGSTWARWGSAAGKVVKCDGQGSSWNCSLRARACKR